VVIYKQTLGKGVEKHEKIQYIIHHSSNFHSEIIE